MRVSEIRVKRIRVNQGLGVYITKIIMLILTFTHTFSGKKPYSKRTRDQLGLFMKSSETSFMGSPFVLPLEASVC